MAHSYGWQLTPVSWESWLGCIMWLRPDSKRKHFKRKKVEIMDSLKRKTQNWQGNFHHTCWSNQSQGSPDSQGWRNRFHFPMEKMCIQWENKMTVYTLRQASAAELWKLIVSALENLLASLQESKGWIVKATVTGTLQSHSTQPLGV